MKCRFTWQDEGDAYLEYVPHSVGMLGRDCQIPAIPLDLTIQRERTHVKWDILLIWATLLRGYINSNSSARLTAARRLLTLSLL